MEVNSNLIKGKVFVMKKKTVLEMIEVMEAFYEGAEIEYNLLKISKVWADTTCPEWNWWDCDYRVKTEPLERWVIVDGEGAILMQSESEDYINDHVTEIGFSNCRKVLMREVRDE